MEGIYWLRLSGIVALFVGSIYVLMPTLLQDDLETRLAAQAGSVQTGQTSKGPDLDISFSVEGQKPKEAAKALARRLKAGGIATKAVKAVDGKVVVGLSAGSNRLDVARLAARTGRVTLFDTGPIVAASAPSEEPASTETLSEAAMAWVSSLPAADQPAWSQLLADYTRQMAPIDQSPLDVRVASAKRTDDEERLKLSGALPDGSLAALVVIDGTVTGLAVPDEDAFLFIELTRSLGATVLSDPDAFAILNSVPLQATFTEDAEAADPVVVEEEAVAEVVEGAVPSWVLGLLPNTQMNLGLDLQGGIDLTLQVDLPAAILGQVARDTAEVKIAAATEGLLLDPVRRVHGEPMILCTTDAPLADLDALFRKLFQGDYQRVGSEGTTHTYEMARTRQNQVEDQSVQQVLETLRKRVDATGVKEPSIVKKGGGRINVQLPGMVDVKAAVSAIGTTAILQFRMVDEDYDDAVLAQIITAAEKEMPADQFIDDELLNVFLWDSGRLDRDRLIGWEYEVNKATDEDVRTIALPLMAEVKITGNDIADAGVENDVAMSRTYVTMKFKPRGTRVFCDITTESVGKRFAIILDDQVMSAPNIIERICGGSGRIEMSNSTDPLGEAKSLALVLRTGSLDAPVVVASVRQVGATLGADSIRAGTLASAIGGSIVLVFMLLWYRTSGIIADIALIINILLVLACLAMFGATLTLPGIAGIALTAGMAVDANIIIYERIREELRLGVHPRKAVDVGFEKAIVAVLDANITTAIAGVVLYSYGSGPIKGFAVTLLIGIITTLVSALFVTRTLMDLVTRSSAARLRI